MSDMADSLLPSCVPSVVIHTSTFETGVGLAIVMVFEPGLSGVGGDSTVVSSRVVGVGVAADRIWTEVPVLLTSSVTDPSVVAWGSCRTSPTPFLKFGNGTVSL